MGSAQEQYRLLQVKAENKEIQKNLDLICRYNGKADFLRKPWNDIIIISSIVYDGDGLETVLESWFVQIKMFQISKKNVNT